MRFNKLIVTALIALASSGCSVYDVAAISTDLAIDLFTDVNEGKSQIDNDPHNEPLRFWNLQTSLCVKEVNRRKGLDESLDSMFGRIENGRDHVELPTGELYPVAQTNRLAELPESCR